MKKNIFKILYISLFILVIVLVILLFKQKHKRKIYTSGDFTFYIKNDIYDRAVITGLSEEGKEKEALIVPKVLGRHFVGGVSKTIHFEKAKRIYIPEYIEGYERFDVPEIILMYKLGSRSKLGYKYGNEYHPVTTNLAYYEKRYDEKKYPDVGVHTANVTYYVDNRQRSWVDNYSFEYEVYWVDDYDNSKILYPAKNPEKNGYIFTGWYKDEACTIKWDFENDIVPKKEYDSDGGYIYHETKLYAGWI